MKEKSICIEANATPKQKSRLLLLARHRIHNSLQIRLRLSNCVVSLLDDEAGSTSAQARLIKD